jgi:hypothetical protein
MALAGWYNPLDRHPFIRDVCLVAKVGLGVQHVSGEPEFTNWESKIDAGSSPGPGFWHQNVRKTLHIAHKGGSREVSYVISADWPRKNGTAASLGWSGLK